MATYAYNRSIPNGPNNPSNDQPKMQTNTNSTMDLIGEDHITFEASNGGMHKWARLVNTDGAFNSPITGMISTAGGLYTRTIGNGNQLLYRNGSQNIEYQLTSATSSGSISTFANNTNYTGTLVGGWTFLPGRYLGNPSNDDAMVLQYGFVTNPTKGSDGGSVTFPRAYNNAAYSVTISIQRNDSNVDTIYVKATSTSGFTYRNTSSGGITGFYWMAIGV